MTQVAVYMEGPRCCVNINEDFDWRKMMMRLIDKYSLHCVRTAT